MTTGSYVLAVTPGRHNMYRPNATLIGSFSTRGSSPDVTWSAANTRIYFPNDAVSPDDINWERIDPATGSIIGAADSPYTGAYEISPPVRVAPDGSRVLLGSGDIYDGTTLALLDSLTFPPQDGLWIDGHELLTLEDDDGDALLRHFDAQLQLYNLMRFQGEPLRVLEWEAGIAVVTLTETGPIVHAYVPSDDADGDGVPSPEDAFPLDPAASQDGDGDGTRMPGIRDRVPTTA